MRVGIVGLGSIGKRHGTNAEALGHDVAYCDVRSETLAHFAAVADMLGYFNPDAVMICTPANTHSHIARELLDLGYVGPLFCEKPLALSVEECAIFREWPHVTTMTGYMLRFHDEIVAMKRLRPTDFTLELEWDSSKYGPELAHSDHEIDLALHFGGEISDVWRYAGCWHLRFGASSMVKICADSQTYARRWDVQSRTAGRWKLFEDPDDLGQDMYRAELAHFLECVQNNTPTITPFADGIRVVSICEEAMKMAGAQA